MRVHRNLIWLATDLGTLDLLLADGPLGGLVAAPPPQGSWASFRRGRWGGARVAVRHPDGAALTRL